MFEITPLHFAIGRGWFNDQLGFSLEFDLLTMNLFFRKKGEARYLHGSLVALYFDIWKEDGKWNKEISGDFLYLQQFFKKKNPPPSAIL